MTRDHGLRDFKKTDMLKAVSGEQRDRLRTTRLLIGLGLWICNLGLGGNGKRSFVRTTDH